MASASGPASNSETPRGGSGEMFDRIADRYDLLNRILSLGIDQAWRHQAVQALSLGSDSRVLDLATGTADLAILEATTHPGCRVVGVDPSGRMLEIGRGKVERAGLSERVTLEVGDAQALPFETGSFDATSIAFGIRNVPDRAKALGEMARVTRSSGRVVVLELAEPRSGFLGPLARFHVHSVVPWLGGLISGSREYRYLQRSIAGFPPPDAFVAIMEGAGLRVLEARALTFGVATLFVAEPGRAS
jgi:demethylmenaquinone methyltransferase/2-methoxy-6-polyprenyl-1,4-benzoquinol methylase